MNTDQIQQASSRSSAPICIGVKQLASRINISVSGIYLNAAHLPPHFKLNGRRMYLLSEIEKWECAMAEQSSSVNPRA